MSYNKKKLVQQLEHSFANLLSKLNNLLFNIQKLNIINKKIIDIKLPKKNEN